VIGRLDAFDARTLPADARERKCILCSDPATRGDLCDACHGAHEFASEHPVRCACGACLMHAKIEQRRAAVSL